MLIINNLSFSYNSRKVFEDLNLSFSKGWTALVGPNGSGKSTLLRLIRGALVPDSGNIYANGSVVHCPQTAEEPPEVPTNHMDSVSAMSLAEAVQEYAGAVVIITHDRVFAEKTGKIFWQLEREGNEGNLSVH